MRASSSLTSGSSLSGAAFTFSSALPGRQVARKGQDWQRQLPASKSRSGRTAGVGAVHGVVGAQGSEPLACPLKGELHSLGGDHLRVPGAGARVHDGEDGVAGLRRKSPYV